MVSATGFQQRQNELAYYLRDPDARVAPAIEQRRLDIYSGLIYNNIENFIRSGFPILRRLYDDNDWQELVRGFIRDHRSESPYFLEISQEFLHYLRDERSPEATDPAFLLELAHYEWVELALDVAEADFDHTEVDQDGDLMTGIPALSPLAWSLQYRYPVHRIGVEFRPERQPEQPTYLIVYRNRADEVKFMESNSVTARLLELIDRRRNLTGRELLLQIARELGREGDVQILTFGADLLTKLSDQDILLGTAVHRVAEV